MTALEASPPSRSESRATRSQPESGDAPAYQFRAGGRVLSLFSTTLHGLILRTLANGPVALSDLRQRAGEPTQTTLRGNLGNLIGIGALEKRRPDGERDLLDNELTSFGNELLLVSEVIEAWLARAPRGPLSLEDDAGKDALRALNGGWGSTMLRALAARPLTVSELDELISSSSRSTLERRLTMMEFAGQLRRIPDGGASVHAVTDWLREGAAPLLAAMRCERLYLAAETAPVARIDVEAILLLSVPLISLADGVDGVCQLAVVTDEGPKQGLAGVTVEIEQGSIASCVSTLEPALSDRVSGPVGSWLDAVIDGADDRLDAGSVGGLAPTLIEGLRHRFFAPVKAS